jgi:hypothetical protein
MGGTVVEIFVDFLVTILFVYECGAKYKDK